MPQLSLCLVDPHPTVASIISAAYYQLIAVMFLKYCSTETHPCNARPRFGTRLWTKSTYPTEVQDLRLSANGNWQVFRLEFVRFGAE